MSKLKYRKTKSRAYVVHMWVAEVSGTSIPSWKKTPLESPPWGLSVCGSLGIGMSPDVNKVNCKSCMRTAAYKSSKSPEPIHGVKKP